MHHGSRIDKKAISKVVAPLLHRSDEASAKALSHVRSCGMIRLGFKQTDSGTKIADFYQAGCLRVRLPRSAAGADPCAMLLNTSGGIADGDRLRQNISWGDRTRASVTTAAAEKVYRAMAGGGNIETRLVIGAQADAEWLPQETILFDRARLVRDTQVRLAEDAAFLGIEAVVLGRTARDEVIHEGALLDTWRIWRGGRLIYADALRLEGPIGDLMDRPAIGAGARAMAVLIHVSCRAASLLGDVRAALAEAAGAVAASAWNGMLVIRLLARDGAALRRDMLRVLTILRGGRTLPRAWSC
jgi:urease accessory protein